MSRALIVYGSRHGHAKRIAERLAEIARERGHETVVADAATAPDVTAFDLVVLSASIQMGRHPRSVERFARAQKDKLSARPSLLVSVSLSAQGPVGSEGHRAAERCVEDFVRRTGFHPARVELLAGDLPYTKYGIITRLVMRAIARSQGGPTDTSRDYDFTDWPAVERLATEIFPVAPQIRRPQARGDSSATQVGATTSNAP